MATSLLQYLALNSDSFFCAHDTSIEREEKEGCENAHRLKQLEKKNRNKYNHRYRRAPKCLQIIIPEFSGNSALRLWDTLQISVNSNLQHPCKEQTQFLGGVSHKPGGLTKET